MPGAPDYYAQGAEALVVGLARTGDHAAFGELVRRRQSWIRNLLRSCSGDAVLADDLAQKTFLQAWRKIEHLRDPERFGAWLKRMAINTWLQHARRNDALDAAGELTNEGQEPAAPGGDSPGTELDLAGALARIEYPVRLCIVLSYQEGMTHGEIAEFTRLPLGTVKSHIRRGSARLQSLLSAYTVEGSKERSP